MVVEVEEQSGERESREKHTTFLGLMISMKCHKQEIINEIT